MLISGVFVLIMFGGLALLCFFIAKIGPEGQFKSMPYNRLPGIMTPNTLSSRQAWTAAHKSMSPYFTILSAYCVLSAAINIILMWREVNIDHGAVFIGSFMIGIAFFALLVFFGDRVASKCNQGMDDSKA